MNKTAPELRHWRFSRDGDDIAWLTIDCEGESTNTLGEAVITELRDVLVTLEASLPRGLVIMSGKASGFIAGADIREFERYTDAQVVSERIREGHQVFAQLERLECPTIAAVSGFCLGGGYELALCCDYIIAHDMPDTRIGLPEVKLGIFPGLGGTVRLPERIGGLKALEAMLTGRLYRAGQARARGMIDELVGRHGTLRWSARRAVMQKRTARKPSITARLGNTMPARQLLAQVMRKQTSAKANPKHYPAPFKLIENWRVHGGDRKALFEAEAVAVGQLMVSPQAAGLRRVFNLMEQLKGLGKQADFKCRRVHVIGAGVMGGDIAAWCASQGMEVTLQDREMKYIEPAIKRARKLFSRRARTRPAMDAVMARFTPDVDGQGVARADVVIEAIFENVEAKQALFSRIEPMMRPDAVLATNTSAIPLETLATVLQRPDRLIGLHFFNPVAKMPLVEVVHGEGTEKEMVERGNAFCGQINRFPLPVRSSPGFLVNRVLAPYMNEAMEMVIEGVDKEIVDAAALHFGMPMGPIELVDTVGLDVGLSVARNLGAGSDHPVVGMLEKFVERGDLGKKTGEGFYKWSKGKPVRQDPQSDPDIERRARRLLKPFLDECRACSRDGIVDNDDLLDAGIIFGTGFAPFKGGPMHYLASHNSSGAAS